MPLDIEVGDTSTESIGIYLDIIAGGFLLLFLVTAWKQRLRLDDGAWLGRRKRVKDSWVEDGYELQKLPPPSYGELSDLNDDELSDLNDLKVEKRPSNKTVKFACFMAAVCVLFPFQCFYQLGSCTGKDIEFSWAMTIDASTFKSATMLVLFAPLYVFHAYGFADVGVHKFQWILKRGCGLEQDFLASRILVGSSVGALICLLCAVVFSTFQVSDATVIVIGLMLATSASFESLNEPSLYTVVSQLGAEYVDSFQVGSAVCMLALPLVSFLLQTFVNNSDEQTLLQSKLIFSAKPLKQEFSVAQFFKDKFNLIVEARGQDDEYQTRNQFDYLTVKFDDKEKYSTKMTALNRKWGTIAQKSKVKQLFDHLSLHNPDTGFHDTLFQLLLVAILACVSIYFLFRYLRRQVKHDSNDEPEQNEEKNERNSGIDALEREIMNEMAPIYLTQLLIWILLGATCGGQVLFLDRSGKSGWGSTLSQGIWTIAVLLTKTLMDLVSKMIVFTFGPSVKCFEVSPRNQLFAVGVILIPAGLLQVCLQMNSMSCVSVLFSYGLTWFFSGLSVAIAVRSPSLLFKNRRYTDEARSSITNSIFRVLLGQVYCGIAIGSALNHFVVKYGFGE